MDITNPKISIITVVYNGVRYIEKTIQSIIDQTYDNIEYIIIDGGSTDGTIDIIRKYEDKISHWESERDKGIYYAMNKGLNKASGEWVNFMNAGDWLYSPSTITDVFLNRDVSGADLVYGKTEKRNLDDILIYTPGNETNFWKRLLIHQSIFSRTTVHKKYMFDTSFKVSADFDYIYKIFFYKHAVLYVDVIVSSFDLIGFSHHNRYIGFGEDRKIAMRYKGNPVLSVKVYLYYVKVTLLGRTIDLLKKYTPKLYLTLKGIKKKRYTVL